MNNSYGEEQLIAVGSDVELLSQPSTASQLLPSPSPPVGGESIMEATLQFPLFFCLSFRTYSMLCCPEMGPVNVRGTLGLQGGCDCGSASLCEGVRMKNLVLSALATSAVVIFGIAGEIVGVPWVLLIPGVAIVAWPAARRLATTHEFAAILSLALVVAVFIGTMTQNRPMFSSTWFVGLMGLIALSSVLCLIDKLPRVRKCPYIFVHGAVLLVLAGAAAKNYGKEEGFLHMNIGRVTNKMLVMRNGEIAKDADGKPTGEVRNLPFSVRLDDFRVEFYDPKAQLFVFKEGEENAVAALDLSKREEAVVEGRKVKALGVRETAVAPMPGHPPILSTVADFEVDGNRGNIREGEAVTIGNLALVFRSRPGKPKLYESKLSILDAEGNVVKTQEVVVNAPLVHDGWWLYQADWDPMDLTYSGIQVVKDPGAVPAMIGLVLLGLGALAKVRLPLRTKGKTE